MYNQSGLYWSKRQWVAVASAGPYASLHLQIDNHASTPPLSSLLQAGCPSCCPTNSVKALAAVHWRHCYEKLLQMWPHLISFTGVRSQWHHVSSLVLFTGTQAAKWRWRTVCNVWWQKEVLGDVIITDVICLCCVNKSHQVPIAVLSLRSDSSVEY